MFFVTRAAVVLLEEIQYDFGKFRPEQRITFKAMCKDVRRNGGNEYDAACMFMLIMADSLPDPNEYHVLVSGWVDKLADLTPRMTVTYATEVEQTYLSLLERLRS